MTTILLGMGLLLLTLAGFSLFSMKAPKDRQLCPDWQMQLWLPSW